MQHQLNPVLLVDATVDARESLRDILEAEGYSVEIVDDGRAALDRLLGGLRPCVILYDLMSPTMNGVEFHVEQLAQPTLRGIPLVTYAGLKDLRRQAERRLKDDAEVSADVGRLLAVVRQQCNADS